jgi:hypothetical protein
MCKCDEVILDNKEKKALANKITYNIMKDKIIDCECGVSYKYYNKSKHENSKKHYNRLNPDTVIKYAARGVSKKEQQEMNTPGSRLGT